MDEMRQYRWDERNNGWVEAVDHITRTVDGMTFNIWYYGEQLHGMAQNIQTIAKILTECKAAQDKAWASLVFAAHMNALTR